MSEVTCITFFSVALSAHKYVGLNFLRRIFNGVSCFVFIGMLLRLILEFCQSCVVTESYRFTITNLILTLCYIDLPNVIAKSTKKNCSPKIACVFRTGKLNTRVSYRVKTREDLATLVVAFMKDG